ncbi:hypothetical protein [endosymbiont GvMRE of Glomus versiforme]|uniref:hypothetical protein n=1 Tax=endosymbiont GvMRE of Glomus versiforme TaxID=2039283 RepID=UPI000EE95A27|nr:hypothetical protein [endosymbiont GvMRE of Glomus versiforme]RHZ36475.1 hypothetical protein GvMRE_I2g205 [endosymbiont GvMRE of Glomus versiforme]
MNNHKRLNAQANNHEQFATESRVFQELREIKNEIKEVKKFLIINSLRHLANNYEKITRAKQGKLAKDWELAEKDETRKKEIAEWDEIQEQDEVQINNGSN